MSLRPFIYCLLYTSDAADEEDSVDLGGRRIIKKNQLIRGHEFHYWKVEHSSSEFELKKNEHNSQLSFPWEIKSWETKFKNEGWSDNKLHASWIHLHLPSCPKAAKNFINATQVNYSQNS